MASEEDRTGRIRPVAFDLGIEGYEDPVIVGRGGFAVVYRARQRSFNRTVAIKVLTTGDLDDAAIRRFDRERAAIGALSGHPNIVTVYDSGFTAAGAPYLAMEHLGRGSLAERLGREGPHEWQSVVAIGIKLAGGLETAHRLGVLHRDIKPENVMMSDFGEPKLADFGIAHVVGGPETRSAHIELSVLHAPPEIVDGKKAAATSDVYALASTLVTMLRGRPPFYDEGDSLVRLLVRIGTEPLPDLTASGVPRRLQDVLEKAMAKDPGARHPSALELARDLQNVQRKAGLTPTPVPLAGPDDVLEVVVDGSPAVTERVGPTRQAAAPTSTRAPVKRRWHLWAGVAVVVIAAGVAIGAALASRQDKPPPPEPTTTIHTQPPAPTTPPPTVPVTPFPAIGGALAAGSYHSTSFKPDVRLTLDAGWSLVSAEKRNYLELSRADSPDALLGFYIVDQSIDPAAAPPEGTKARAAAQALPSDIRQWFVDHGRLSGQATGPASVGGRSGWVANFTVANAYPYNAGRCLNGTCVLLFRAENPISLVPAYPGDQNRFYAIPEGNQLLLVTVSAPAGTYARFSAEADAVLRSLHLGS